jgi:hypothetical protein
MIREKRVDLLRRRRQAVQIISYPSQPARSIRFRGRFNSLLFKPSENESIDIISRPAPVLDLWHRNRSRWRNERPMRFVLRPFNNPLAQSLLLRIRQTQMRSRRRHHIIGIGCENATDENTLLRLVRNNRVFLWILARSVRARRVVETQLRFPTA